MVNGLRSGGCTVHANKCGATQGMFLKLRTCEVLLLSESKRGDKLMVSHTKQSFKCNISKV